MSIINGRIVSDYDILCARAHRKQVTNHRKDGYQGEWRLTLNGDVISHNKHSADLERYLFQHIESAITRPGFFAFDGIGGRMGAKEWLDHHSDRLGIETWSGALCLLDQSGNVLRELEIH